MMEGPIVTKLGIFMSIEELNAEIDAVDKYKVFYDQFGNAFTWAEGYGESDLDWIDYELWLDDANKEEK